MTKHAVIIFKVSVKFNYTHFEYNCGKFVQTRSCIKKKIFATGTLHNNVFVIDSLTIFTAQIIHSHMYWGKICLHQARNQGEGRLGHLPPEIFKTFHSSFDICRSFQMIKMKSCILITFKKSVISIFLCPTGWLSPCQIYLETGHLTENFGAGIVKTWEFV